uniref:Protein Wnt n=1 Tax=Panagrellus redivivus TaxID=6233 RepID=A0A7E4UYG7_PANRE
MFLKSLLFLSILTVGNAQNWWQLSHLSSTPTQPQPLDCDALPGLSPRQRELCYHNPDAMRAVIAGLRNALVECRSQFAGEHWNCSGNSGFGDTPSSVASKESAYVYAITAAGVSHAVAQACAKGLLPDCGCGEMPKEDYLKQLRTNAVDGVDYVWSGCSDNVKYGNSFGRRFIDSVEKRLQSEPRALMNLHNNRAGRKLLSKSMRKHCKCHGVSGSCVTKTCWETVPPFEDFAKALKEKYEEAHQVTVKPNSSDLMVRVDEFKTTVAGPRAGRYLDNHISAQDPRMRRAARNDLVFLENSPDFCNAASFKDMYVSSGRECDDEKHCQKLCCGRGWTSHYELKEEPCKCKFIWCCEVKCETCVRSVLRHFCR